MRVCAFGALASVTVVLVHKLLVLEGGRPDEEFVALVGLFVTLAALAAALGRLLPPLHLPSAEKSADDLAVTVQTQWEDEVAARRLRHPRVIPLTWTATERPVADEPPAPGPVRVLRRSLDGRLDGTFDEAARGLVARYRRAPGGRLVVLGEPGAGKTVLATVLVLGLLAERAPGEPVPVLLSVSTWDPVDESLDDWMAHELSTAYFGGQSEIPRLLLTRRPRNRPLLLRVLDGLDEMPEAARRTAVRALNEACDDGRGAVLTCRSTEYQDVVEGGSPVLRRAPVVELTRVGVPDATAYLRDVEWPDGTDWAPVFAHLSAHPDGPLATALSTPLSLSLARTVYRTGERHPSELLAFTDRHAVEDHLIDHTVTAAYAPPPGAGRQETADRQAQAERAEKWLTYLATYLHRHRDRDLAWWLMSRRLMPRCAGLVLGIAAGILAVLAVAALTLVLDEAQHWQAPCAYAGAGFAVLTTIAWYAAPERPPGRLSPTVRGSAGRLRRGFLTGIAPATIWLTPVMATAAVITTVSEGWSTGRLLGNLTGIGAAAGVITALGLALAAHEWLDAPPKRSTGTDPVRLLRRDRAASLAGALCAGSVLGAALAPLVVLGLSVAHLLNLSLTNTSTRPSLADITMWIATGAHGHPYRSPLSAAAYTLLPAALCALLVLLSRAWTRFALLRFVLAVRGRLPWRLARFLDDARSRQLLRQSAGTYRFRHIRLQERLASRSLARDRAPRPRPVRRHLQAAAAAVAVVLLSGGFGLARLLPGTPSRTSLLTGAVDALAFTPDDRTLVTVTGATVRKWDVSNGREHPGQRTRIRHLTARPKSLTVRTDGTLHLLDADSHLHTVPPRGSPSTARKIHCDTPHPACPAAPLTHGTWRGRNPPPAKTSRTRLVTWRGNTALIRTRDGKKSGPSITDTRTIDHATLNHNGTLLATNGGEYTRVWDVG